MSREYLTEKADFNAHVGNKSNPHGVTAAQAGAQKETQVFINVNCKTLHEPGNYIMQSEPATRENNVSLGLPEEDGHWGLSIYATLIQSGDNGKEYVCCNRDSGNLYYMREVNGNYSKWKRIATANETQQDFLAIGTNVEYIPENADLNTYVAVGNFSCRSHDSAKTIVNFPAGENKRAFKLYVMSSIGTTLNLNHLNHEYGYISQYLVTLDPTAVFTREISKEEDNVIQYKDWKRFVSSDDLASYLPISGGTMTGDLFLANHHARLRSDYQGSILEVFDSEHNVSSARGFWVRNRTQNITKEEAFSIFEILDGTVYNYTLFGQHNPSLLASTIQNLIQTGEVRTLDEGTKATLSSIEKAVQKNYAEMQQESADAITLDLLERGIL